MRDASILTPEAIRRAHAAIPPVFRDTPQYVHEGLSARVGEPVVAKVETVNPIGSFKGRGTWVALQELVRRGEIGRDRAVVVASTGNFGQGIAYAARALGVPAVVYADAHANPSKLERIRSFGATVVQEGRDFDAARAASAAKAAGEGSTLLVDGDEPAIATGAGSIGLELTAAADRGDLPPLANAYIPVGNGSLIIGIGSWLRAVSPGCRVVGVQSDAAPSMTLSWRAHRPIETETAATAAEGIATRVPVPRALELMDGRVDDMLLIPERDLEGARRELQGALGVLVEHSAAVSWLGLRADAARVPGASLLLITGGNAAPA